MLPEWIRLAILFAVGMTGSGLVAAGVFALVVKVGVISRMVARTKTAVDIKWYEDVILLGATLGNTYAVFQPEWSFSIWLLLPAGFFFGCFTGCLSLALAETVNAFPVFARRAKLTMGLSYLVLALALGKFAASWALFIWNGRG